MDAITLLKGDHKTVEQLFKKYQQLGDQANKTKSKLVQQIITELSVHAAIEEQLFYPVVRAEVPAEEDLVLESLEEHHIVKWTLSELEGMKPTDERFDAKVNVLIESVRHHVKEEETSLFPGVRKALGRKELTELGERMAKAKKAAPTRPHPKAPDSPPGNLVAGAASGMLDKARTVGKETIERAREAVD